MGTLTIDQRYDILAETNYNTFTDYWNKPLIIEGKFYDDSTDNK